MNWGSWGTWGEWWALLCVGVTIAAANTGDLAVWWIPLILAGVLGYVGLNFLQRQVEREELVEDLDEPSEVERLEASIASLRRVARDFRSQHEVRRALEIEAVLRDREQELARALEFEAQPRAVA